jgi:hypothetical protein
VLQPVEGLELRDISTEVKREYVLPNGRLYTIYAPIGLYVKKGSHRVVDANGLAHYIQFGPEVVLRWQNKDSTVPVNF